MVSVPDTDWTLCPFCEGAAINNNGMCHCTACDFKFITFYPTHRAATEHAARILADAHNTASRIMVATMPHTSDFFEALLRN